MPSDGGCAADGSWDAHAQAGQLSAPQLSVWSRAGSSHHVLAIPLEEPGRARHVTRPDAQQREDRVRHHRLDRAQVGHEQRPRVLVARLGDQCRLAHERLVVLAVGIVVLLAVKVPDGHVRHVGCDARRGARERHRAQQAVLVLVRRVHLPRPALASHVVALARAEARVIVGADGLLGAVFEEEGEGALLDEDAREDALLGQEEARVREATLLLDAASRGDVALGDGLAHPVAARDLADAGHVHLHLEELVVHVELELAARAHRRHVRLAIRLDRLL
mmetsp:Transcript_23782/g.58865  ORF Transcript_23782/g.58865 Transcript_23782/m.58865 type:complete len:277 (-) Transcript_23782:188-1018(-)